MKRSFRIFHQSKIEKSTYHLAFVLLSFVLRAAYPLPESAIRVIPRTNRYDSPKVGGWVSDSTLFGAFPRSRLWI